MSTLTMTLPPAPWDCREPDALASLRAQYPRSVLYFAVSLWRTEPDELLPDPGEWRGIALFGREVGWVERMTGLEGFRNAHGVRTMLLGGTDRERLFVALEQRHRAWHCAGSLDCSGWGRCPWPEIACTDRLDPHRFPTIAEVTNEERRDPRSRYGLEVAPGRRVRLRGVGGVLPTVTTPSDAPLTLTGCAAVADRSDEPADVRAARVHRPDAFVFRRERLGRRVGYTISDPDAELVAHVVGLPLPTSGVLVLEPAQFHRAEAAIRRARWGGVAVIEHDKRAAQAAGG